MKVIEKYNDSLHNPYWKYQLGKEAYEVKDTPQRVESIKKSLHSDERFDFITAKQFPDRLITQLHPYHDYIRNTALTLNNDEEEFYPDLFPGEGAHLKKRDDSPLWGGIWCTDAVTPIKRKTYEVARASAESALTGAELISQGQEKTVYALCRPSGHHAGPRVFGGYCYFNNVATAAQYLLAKGKVAIVDIDYHHGNGTQEFFDDIKSIFTASIHGDPEDEYPYFWGYAEETGKGQAEGTNHNEPLAKGTQLKEYSKALKRILKKIKAFNPAFLIIAAGFDTHETDPIGSFKIRTEDYETIGKQFKSLDLPTLVCQEGGYNTDVLGECVKHFLIGLM
ncbi:histone deacetylase family protein [Oceanispirochaeta sp.]|jgi:acetoin utilization deacetylase AcuC-like enzyme|uniref:histone deacetylase family protein n=1 Tax=Oceanispirochaeta sp. TaxID=2035350 RepID=UPI00262D5290|nr:histone deacetylase family protein [Oceanispirochaeta sp.]MDA3958932.1 histone deacetylase family protein [Oceanispirochaeta sp.]